MMKVKTHSRMKNENAKWITGLNMIYQFMIWLVYGSVNKPTDCRQRATGNFTKKRWQAACVYMPASCEHFGSYVANSILFHAIHKIESGLKLKIEMIKNVWKFLEVN